MKPRIVVVGLGSIGRRHARLLAARGDVAVEWCETSPEALTLARKDCGEPAAIHKLFSEAIASRPAMMVIATPHTAHATQSIAALEAGIHVLCEKPLSDTLADGRAMVDAAAKARAVFTVGFHLHFHPAVKRMCELVRGGELGSIHHVHALVGTYGTLQNSKSNYQKTLFGALFMDYAHQPDLFHHILGRVPHGVYAAGGQGGSLPLQSNPNFAAIVCDYSDALITTIHLNYLQSPDRHEYEIIGDRGWISVDMFRGELRFAKHGDANIRTETFPFERDGPYRDEHQAFFDAIAGKRQPESPASAALVSMEVIDAALRSLSERQRVAL